MNGIRECPLIELNIESKKELPASRKTNILPNTTITSIKVQGPAQAGRTLPRDIGRLRLRTSQSQENVF